MNVKYFLSIKKKLKTTIVIGMLASLFFAQVSGSAPNNSCVECTLGEENFSSLPYSGRNIMKREPKGKKSKKYYSRKSKYSKKSSPRIYYPPVHTSISYLTLTTTSSLPCTYTPPCVTITKTSTQNNNNYITKTVTSISTHIEDKPTTVYTTLKQTTTITAIADVVSTISVSETVTVTETGTACSTSTTTTKVKTTKTKTVSRTFTATQTITCALAEAPEYESYDDNSIWGSWW